MDLCKKGCSLAIQCLTQANKTFFGATLVQVRHRSYRHLPQKKKKNPFVKRHTDFIKHLCIALVNHERVLTTVFKAQQLQQYGDLVRPIRENLNSLEAAVLVQPQYL